MKKLLILLLLPSIIYSACGQKSKVVPYQVDSRPLPKGADFNKLLPLKVGSFKRITFTPPEPTTDGYSTYKSGNDEIIMAFSLSDTPSDLGVIFETITAEIRNDKGNPKIVDIKSAKKRIYIVGKDDTFFAWNRGLYCFSVQGDQAKIGEFMKHFPY